MNRLRSILGQSELAATDTLARSVLTGTMLVALVLSAGSVYADGGFLNAFLPLQVSTVPAPPASGDMNPYGLAFVPPGIPSGGILKPGQMVISNFNDTMLQGRGSTIVTIDPRSGETGLFFQGTPPIGFTNALGVVHAGLVFAGSVPTTDGMSDTVTSGGLYVLDVRGNVVAHLGTNELINGPWGLAINDHGGGAHCSSRTCSTARTCSTGRSRASM